MYTHARKHYPKENAEIGSEKTAKFAKLSWCAESSADTRNSFGIPLDVILVIPAGVRVRGWDGGWLPGGGGTYLLGELIILGLEVFTVTTPRSVEFYQHVALRVINNLVKVLSYGNLWGKQGY